MARNRKRNVDESEGGESEAGAGRAKWPKELFGLLCDLCLQYVEKSKGKRGEVTCQKILWSKIVPEFQKQTNLSWDKSKLKNKLDNYKDTWSLWKQLKGRETGLGWDSDKGTISASESWWKAKIKENDRFKGFQDKGINPELEAKLDCIYMCAANGAFKYTPGAENHLEHHELDAPYILSASNHPELNESLGGNSGYEINEWDEMWRGQAYENPTPTSSPFSISQFVQNEQTEQTEHYDTRRGKRVAESDSTQSNKSARIESSRREGGSAGVLDKIEGLMQEIFNARKESKDVQVSIANYLNAMTVNAPKHDITEAYAKLCTLEGLECGSNLFFFTLAMLEDPQKRTIFFQLPDDQKLKYITYNFNHQEACMECDDTQTKLLLLMQHYVDEENEFWDMMSCATSYIATYYLKYIHKEPCMTSYLTGEEWMNEILSGHEKRCFNMLRMNQDVFRQLCFDLENKYGLRPSDRMSILEKVGIFVYVLSKGASNRDAQERFQHSDETISRVFKEVLNAMHGLLRDILIPNDPEFKEIPPYIANDARYMPHFKDYIGAIDGMHISVIVPEEDQMRCRGRKGIPTTNVLAVCDFDMLFTYVLTGWEGSAHDTRIFLDTINNPSLKFPRPPIGKYYLVDKGYPEREGYLTPYPKVRYHQSQFRGANPRGAQEIFNRAHSSLRSCIERAFGVLKARWKILEKMPGYSLMDQNRIICSCFALHNYIRRSALGDPAFRLLDQDPNFVPPDIFQDVDEGSSEGADEPPTQAMTVVRDNITSSLIAARRRH